MILFLKKLRVIMVLFCLFTGKTNAQIYKNGDLSTGIIASSGEAAPAGTVWSEVQLGNMTGGYAGGIAAGYTLADDFTVPAGATWNVSSLSFYAYSTNYTGTTSPFNDLRVQIFDTDPSIGNPTPVFGDLTTNRLTSSLITNIYRIFNATPNTNRMIWTLTASVSFSLPAGTYWIEWQTGTTQTSNFSPPSTVAGTVTQPGNNAQQHNLADNTWAPILDGPNATDPQDMPFQIDYTCVGAATITTQPVDATVCLGTPATFSCVATGSNLSYQWQVSTDGGVSFTDLVAATSATYTTTPVTSSMNGFLYQVIISSPCGIVNSNIATLYVIDIPIITTQPASGAVCPNGSTTLSVTVSGINVQYQWEMSSIDCTTGFTSITAQTSPGLTTPNLNQTTFFRCRITNGCGGPPVYSDCATIIVNATLNITTQPVNQSVCSGSDVTFTVGASSGSATYQWEVGGGGCAGSFSPIGGATSPNLTLTGVTTAQNNVAYRCVVFSSCATSVTSDCATLTVNSIDITTQPVDQDVCEGSTAVFSVATSAPGVNYQWQVSTNNGALFTDIAGANSSNLSIPNVTMGNGNQYQVILTNSLCPVPVESNVAILTVSQPAFIYTQPSSVTACENSTVQFSVIVTSQSTVLYQWQINTGTGWVDIPGETNDVLNVIVTSSVNGAQYHVLITGTVCTSTIVSDDATLIVDPISPVTITANPAGIALLPGQTTILTATPDVPGTYTYSWQADGTDIPGANSDTYIVDYDHAATDYTATLTSTFGNCYTLSNTIHVKDSISGLRMQVYSNPNNGNFTIVYPNLPAGSSVEILDSHGQRAYNRTNLAANLPIHVDMHATASGVYIIVLNNGGAERLATERVVIIH